MIRECRNCNNQFITNRKIKVFCSRKCQLGHWIKNHPERRTSIIRKYNETHREEQKERTKKYYRENKEKVISYQKKFREQNSARTRAKVVMKNKEKICSMCNSVVNIHIHHIDKNPMNNKLENLIFLCSLCHGKQHQI